MIWNPNRNAFDPANMPKGMIEAPPTGTNEWQGIQLLYRCIRKDEDLGRDALRAERAGDHQGAWLAMATRAEQRRFAERLQRDLALMWAGRLQRAREAAKALHGLATVGIWGQAQDAGTEGTMMEAAGRIFDPHKPAFERLMAAGFRVRIKASPKTSQLTLSVDGCNMPRDWHTRGLESTKYEASKKPNPTPDHDRPEEPRG